MRERPRVHMPRALAVLALVVGVLALHGLASSHHGATATPSGAAAHPTMDSLDGRVHAGVVAAAHDVVQDGHDCGGACQGSEHALVLLCVAALLAAGVGILLLRQRAGPVPRRVGSSGRARARAPAPPRSFDLVAELCISRT